MDNQSAGISIIGNVLGFQPGDVGSSPAVRCEKLSGYNSMAEH